METNKCKKTWAVVVLVIALVFAVLACFWPQDRLAEFMYVTRFFDVTLPILAIGALIKYLFKCGSCCACCCVKK